MRDIKFEIMFLVHNKDFTKSIKKHYTSLDRLTNGKDNMNYDDIFVIAKRMFTGLQDKNGVDIYEGDIVTVKTGVTNGDVNYWSVEYVDHLAHCGIQFYGSDRRFNIKASRSSIVNNDAEVVGNIHQSPELLEQ